MFDKYLRTPKRREYRNKHKLNKPEQEWKSQRPKVNENKSAMWLLSLNGHVFDSDTMLSLKYGEIRKLRSEHSNRKGELGDRKVGKTRKVGARISLGSQTMKTLLRVFTNVHSH